MLDFFPSFLTFLFLIFLTISTANTLIWRYFPDEVKDVFDWVILFFILVTGQMLLVLGVIGFAGHLNLGGQILGTVILYLFGGFRIAPFGGVFHIGTREGWKKFRQMLFAQQFTFRTEWLMALFGFLILFVVVELFNAFLQFPWEYDTIAYHLPIVIEWVKSGSLWEIFYAVWGGPLGYYPAHHELLMTWMVLPFGHDLFVNTLNFPIMGVTIAVVYKLLKALGVDDFLAFLGGALTMVMPVFLRQLGTSQVDLLLALGVLMSWYYLLRSYQRRDGRLLIPLLLSLALVLGTKYLGVLYVLPPFFVMLFLLPLWKRSYPRWWIWTAFFLGAFGCMWYLRNWVITGNPLYPAEVSLGTWTVFEGYPGLMERIQSYSLWETVTSRGQWDTWISTMIAETGWYLYLVVGAYVLLIVEVLYKLMFSGLARGEGKIFTLLLFFLPVYWYLYFTAPYTATMMEHNVRYAMPWLLLAMIMVVYSIQKLGPLRAVAQASLFALLLWEFLSLVFTRRLGEQLFLETKWVQAFPSFFLLFVVVLGAWWMTFESWRKYRWWRWMVVPVAILISGIFFQQSYQTRLDLRAESWQHKYSFALMKAHAWLDEHAPSDAVIANSLNPLYYPLYGAELKRKVGYVNINACSACDYGSYPSQGLSVRDQADFESWMSNLRAFGAQYLLLGFSPLQDYTGIEPYELTWVNAHRRDFEKVFEEGGVSIWKFKM